MTIEEHQSPSEAVTAEAWRWAVRSDELSPEQHEQLAGWLAEDEVHRAAFGAAVKRRQQFDILRFAQSDPDARDRFQTQLKRHRRNKAVQRYTPLAAAASVVVVALIYWLQLPQSFDASYQTSVGEQRTVDLPDDSAIMLNTATALSVEFSSSDRFVYLEHGEAHFDVNSDARRPFTVFAGGSVVRAVGTAFNIHVRAENGVHVTVTEGEVEVSKQTASSNGAPSVGSIESIEVATAVRVTEGHNTRIAEAIQPPTAVDSEALGRQLSWRNGMLVFVATPLIDVVADASRYTETTIRVTDPSIESLPVTAIAKATNIHGLLSRIDTASDRVTVTHASDSLILISSTTTN